MPGRSRQVDVVFAPIMRASAMRKLDATLRAVAAKDVVVTLIGESGTGKELREDERRGAERRLCWLMTCVDARHAEWEHRVASSTSGPDSRDTDRRLAHGHFHTIIVVRQSSVTMPERRAPT
jgi:hypothetical protein